MDRRVLQADVSEGGIGLAHLYPTREESICFALGHYGYPRTSDLILCKILEEKTGWVTRSRMRR